MKAIIYAILLLMSIGLATAQELYADVIFDVSDSGQAAIKGLTNHPFLSERATNELTSKKGDYWVFNLSINESFSNFVYKINLPRGAVINYVKSPTPVRIGVEGVPYVKSSGKNATMQIAIQYSIEPLKSNFNSIIIILAISAGTILFFYRVKKKMRKVINLPSWYNKDTMTERQRQIVELIEKENKPLTQKELEEKMNIPKSSLSRNIDSLVQKGILVKETKGMTNAIYISQKKPDF